MATGGGGGNIRQTENIFQLLESTDTVNDIRAVILENLSTSKDKPCVCVCVFVSLCRLVYDQGFIMSCMYEIIKKKLKSISRSFLF